MKKIIMIFLSLCLSFCAFAEEWYICLGVFRQIDNANALLTTLQDNFFPAKIEESKNSDDEILYKVVLNESYETKVDAIVRSVKIKTLAIIKELKINDLWCWQKPEPVEIAEIPIVNNVIPISEPESYENRYIYITDSDNGLPVDNANVNIDQTWERWTDYEGKASLPDEITDGEHTMVVTRGDEYVSTTGSFNLEDGKITTANQLAIPKAVDYERVKIILNWGERPSDLDSHVFAPGYHVYYSHMNDGGINLDYDDTTSWGPETVTIRSPNPDYKYEYYIHNFSYSGDREGSSLSNSEASVKLYLNNEYIKTYTITPDKPGIAWHVFDIVNGYEVIDVNEIVTSDHHF